MDNISPPLTPPTPHAPLPSALGMALQRVRPALCATKPLNARKHLVGKHNDFGNTHCKGRGDKIRRHTK